MFWAVFVSTLSTTGIVVAGGPHLAIVAAAYVESLIYGFYMLHRRWAVLCVVLTVLLFAFVVGVQDGWPAPAGQWTVLLATVVATAFLMGLIAERSDVLGESEHQARVELAEMNQTLEVRVADQVTEIERLGQLRRFLSPQVAEAVMSGESEGLTRPHRQRIAVFFCDLRGFTAFTNAAEPEEVVSASSTSTTARWARSCSGTTRPSAATPATGSWRTSVIRWCEKTRPTQAVRMASELREPMNALVDAWTRRGYDLSYGIGVAYGYATLGVIGFDGRYDYTPLGAVVNLAARLCGQASAAQILLDHATHAATSDQLASEHHADLDLKGYGSATRSYALT